MKGGVKIGKRGIYFKVRQYEQNISIEEMENT